MTSSGLDVGCYIYKPEKQHDIGDRDKDQCESALSERRLRAFAQTWDPVERALSGVLEAADAGTVTQICEHLANTNPRTLSRMSAGLVTTSTAGSLFTKVKAQAQKDILLIIIPAAQCTNLKAALKCITSSVSVKTENRLLNYDLDSLKIFMDEQQYEKVLLYFANGESLHGGVLSDLVDVLDSYRTRIPSMLMFETAVSVDLFQEKLTRRALRQLQGAVFPTASAEEVVERIFESMLSNEAHQLLMGPNLATMLLDRQVEHMQSASAFVQEIKYMYMLHFHRSPLSHILSEELKRALKLKEVHTAARETKSFLAFLNTPAANEPLGRQKQLMHNESHLLQLMNHSVGEAREAILKLTRAARAIKIISDHVSQTPLAWSKVYIEAISAQLQDSVLQSLRTSLLELPSDKLLELLRDLKEIPSDYHNSNFCHVEEMIERESAQQEPMRTKYDKSHERTQTKVVGKRITLSKQRATLSQRDGRYTTFVETLAEELLSRLAQALIDPKTVLFNEIFVFDLRVPSREAFSPRPRHALEHALTVPGAYLACECCDPAQRGLSPGQPATAILYQLYLESGVIVNIADLWSAFDAIVPSESGQVAEDGDGVDQNKLALFYRALAELKYLGMVKSSRKRADHLVKLKFIGL